MEKFTDLRDWLDKVREMGELKTITEEVDWDEELAAVTYMVAKEKGGPALLFENVKGSPKGSGLSAISWGPAIGGLR
jgi:4-hydroxy-3-polyprenylbenzoate decarboxylase